MEKSHIINSVQVVAINNNKDLEYAQGKWGTGFYKFPVKGKYPKIKCEYIAFYLSDVDCFKENERRGILYYAKIHNHPYKSMKRRDICTDPDFVNGVSESENNKIYYKIEIYPVVVLDHKIKNQNGHRISYQYTSLSNLTKSKDISDL